MLQLSPLYFTFYTKKYHIFATLQDVGIGNQLKYMRGSRKVKLWLSAFPELNIIIGSAIFFSNALQIVCSFGCFCLSFCLLYLLSLPGRFGILLRLSFFFLL